MGKLKCSLKTSSIFYHLRNNHVINALKLFESVGMRMYGSCPRYYQGIIAFWQNFMLQAFHKYSPIY